MTETSRSTQPEGAHGRPIAWFGVTASFHGLIIPEWPVEPASRLPGADRGPGLGARLAGFLAAFGRRAGQGVRTT